MKHLFYILCVVPLLAACAESGAPAGNAAYDLEIAKGKATSAAVETNAARAANAVMTADARTVVASNRNATLAAQAQQNAMLYAQATSTAQAQFGIATATARYSIQRAAETTQAEQAHFNATSTARAVNATATGEAYKWQTTATAERRTIEAAQAQAQATATAQVIALQIQQTQADAAANAERAQFVQSLLNFVIVILGLIAACVAAFVMIAGALVLVRYANGRAAKQYVIETRAGTILIQRGTDGNYFADIVQREDFVTPRAFPSSDAPSQLPALIAEPETVKFSSSNGTREILKAEPGDARREADRKLVMDLLRESLQYYARKSNGPDVRAVNRIPTWHTLGWGAATWQRAVELLRPHIATREGRGGGTYCVEPYPTLHALYVAVGEQRVALSEIEVERAA